MDLKEEIISENIVYKCPIFSVTEGIVRLPDGAEVCRHKIHHNGGSGILPILENGDVLLVEQYRHGIRQCTLEIPAGKLEAGENPLECAVRELKEEVGCESEHITSLGSIAVSPAYDAEIIYIYMADELKISEQNLDADEFLNVKRLSLAKAVQMVLDGEIRDSKTQIALLKADKILQKNSGN